MKCCSICNREREKGTTIVLTEDEKAIIRRTTLQQAPAEYFYCDPCWKLLQNRTQGAQLFKGLMQSGLSRFGVRNANKVAESYYRFLMERAAKKPVS